MNCFYKESQSKKNCSVGGGGGLVGGSVLELVNIFLLRNKLKSKNDFFGWWGGGGLE